MPIETWSGQLIAVNSAAVGGDHFSGGSPTSLSIGAFKLNFAVDVELS